MSPAVSSSRTAAQRHRGLLQALSRWLRHLTLALNITGSILIVCVMLLVNVDVIGRNVLNQPVSGVPELVTMSVVAIVFLQIAYAFEQGHLTRTVALLGYIERRSLRIRALLEIVLCFVAGAVTLQLFLASWPLFLKAWVRNSYEGTIGGFTVAHWPVKLIILIGCAALLGQILVRALQALYALRYKVSVDDVARDQC